jgi:hypothetical protein
MITGSDGLVDIGFFIYCTNRFVHFLAPVLCYAGSTAVKVVFRSRTASRSWGEGGIAVYSFPEPMPFKTCKVFRSSGAEMKQGFAQDIDFTISLDPTLLRRTLVPWHAVFGVTFVLEDRAGNDVRFLSK